MLIKINLVETKFGYHSYLSYRCAKEFSNSNLSYAVIGKYQILNILECGFKKNGMF